MSPFAFIGDPLSAAGFRLAGARVHSPGEQTATALFRALRDQCRVLLLTAESAAQIPPELLAQTVEQGRPLLLVVPDAAGRAAPTDLEQELRRQLGMAE